MRVLEGQDNYVIYTDETGDVYDGVFIPAGTSIITNLEDVTTDKIEVLTGDEAVNF